MDKKYLFENEKIILQSDGNIITLTNLRIRYSLTGVSQEHIISIFLDKISSIESRYSSKYVFLYLSILGFITSVYFLLNETSDVGIWMLFSIVAIGLLYMYFKSRKHFITITTDGSNQLNFQVDGMKNSLILDFISQIEEAIYNRKK